MITPFQYTARIEMSPCDALNLRGTLNLEKKKGLVAFVTHCQILLSNCLCFPCETKGEVDAV